MTTRANIKITILQVLDRLPAAYTQRVSALRAEVSLDMSPSPGTADIDLAIRELEALPRRIYTGALGWCRADLTQAEFAIPIRTAWVAGEELRFGVGGAVVWDSDPREEYEETLHKGRSLVRCLS